MKYIALLCSCLSVLTLLANPADPTKAADEMADRLRSRLAEAGGLKVWALVVGGETEGVALVGASPEAAQKVRKGSLVADVLDGLRVEARIRSVTAEGVELEPARDGSRVFLPGQFTPLPRPEKVETGFIRHLESERVPLGVLIRLLSDRAGVNISASDAAARKIVSVFLRNVSVSAAVEEVCRTVGLWFRADSAGGVIRIMTMEEYAENLASFREETTETFTLLYPNVTEVAGVIYGLYPDRTLLSLGEQELEEDDENDLSRRFQRFRVLEDNGGSQFMDMQATRSGGMSGSRSGSGMFSFSRGSALSRLTQWDQLRRRRNGSLGAREALSQSDAKTIEGALARNDTNLLAQVSGETTAGAANIFVSLSRKNNMLVVRTSDTRVMEEIRGLVKRLDVPTPMVLMEVKVLELTVDDDYNAKFDYVFNRETHAAGKPLRLDASASQTAAAMFEPTFSFAVASDYIDAQIRLMQKDGKVKVLATPTLLTANNEVSRIFSGKQYPIVAGWTAGQAVSSQSGIVTVPSTVSIERKDVGTMLLITPNINADKTVTLRLMQENSEVSPDKVSIPVNGSSTETGGSVQDVEYVESRSLTGTFVAKDGMSVMAGGLIKETESEVYYRTPVLGSIPLLGWLFRGTEKVKRRTELVVLIKPHVISTPYEGGKISQELMEALSAHPAKDGRPSMGTFMGSDDPTKKERSLRDDLKNMVQ